MLKDKKKGFLRVTISLSTKYVQKRKKILHCLETNPNL